MNILFPQPFIRLILCIFILLLFSCSKLVEIEAPVTNPNSETVYKSDATAIAVMTGVYASISNTQIFENYLTGISLYAGLSADELEPFAGVDQPYTAFYSNNLTVNTGLDFWSTIYPVIFVINSALEGLNASTTLSSGVKDHLLGEAYFMRAFCYFYLVNLYGDVPLVLTTDYTVNRIMPRTGMSDIYAQIIQDLTKAKKLLKEDYLNAALNAATDERIRPNKWAASALLARVYLFAGKWQQSQDEASIVIANKEKFNLVGLRDVFLKNSHEAIWQLQPTSLGANTQEGRAFILPETGPDPSHPVLLQEDLLDAFDSSDQRSTTWVGKLTLDNTDYFYPAKYKEAVLNAPVIEYSMVLRLAELYLIRAEANTQLGKIDGSGGALDDINAIRSRAGLEDYKAPSNKDAALAEIWLQRKLELFTEWGHRWLDLKRTGKVDAVMTLATAKKGGVWVTTQQLYPIPMNEIKLNPKIKQNQNY